ncbi:TPA_asm: hypothetical protein 4 [Manila clam xenomavirus]|nr:TPA_asm: hypothetical protein 4 [Manila clam xenomavirus]
MERQVSRSFSLKERNPKVHSKFLLGLKVFTMFFLIILSAVFIFLEISSQEIWFSIILFCVFSLTGLKLKPSKLTVDPVFPETEVLNQLIGESNGKVEGKVE